jgi:hypothetical protein
MRMIIQGSSWHYDKAQSSVSSVALVENDGSGPWRNQNVGFRVLRPTPLGSGAMKKTQVPPAAPG